MDEKGTRGSRCEEERGGRWGKDALESCRLAVGSCSQACMNEHRA